VDCGVRSAGGSEVGNPRRRRKDVLQNLQEFCAEDGADVGYPPSCCHPIAPGSRQSPLRQGPRLLRIRLESIQTLFLLLVQRVSTCRRSRRLSVARDPLPGRARPRTCPRHSAARAGRSVPRRSPVR
jgi:hypothetical protein